MYMVAKVETKSDAHIVLSSKGAYESWNCSYNMREYLGTIQKPLSRFSRCGFFFRSLISKYLKLFWPFTSIVIHRDTVYLAGLPANLYFHACKILGKYSNYHTQYKHSFKQPPHIKGTSIPP